MKNQLFLEGQSLKTAFLPVDLNTAAVTGGRVSLGKSQKIAIVLSVGASTAAVLDISLKQHNAASGGTTKALSITNPYFYKAAAETVFTKVDVDTAEDNYVLSTLFAADSGIIVFEVNSEDLDLDNSFTHISVDIADSTAAKVGSGVYVLLDNRHQPAYLNEV